ncbi:MAG TPA: ankyrin repeat domain-containing protein [Bacteroidia bacterium]|nr:ankyrin repeat domain-containing protein [Bacteroidia bacterium]
MPAQDPVKFTRHYAGEYYWTEKKAREELSQCPFWKDIRPGMVIADIGAYSGHIDLALSLFFDNLTFYLEESQPDRLNKCGFYEMRSHFEKIHGKPFTNNFVFTVGDNHRTNLPDSAFDMILMNNVFEFISEDDVFLKEIRQKLKKRGKVYVKTTNDFKGPYFIKIFEANGFTCEHAEFSAGQIRMVFNATEKAPPRPEDIFDAVIRRDDDRVKSLLDQGIDVNIAQGSAGLLQIAGSIHTNLKVMELLIERGAKLHSETKFIDSPLSKLAACGEYEEVKLLLDKGARPILEDLSMAAWFSQDVRIVRLLVEHGADPGPVMGKGWKVYDHAALSGNLEIVKYLLSLSEAGDIHARDENGQTFMHWAALGYNTEVMKYLLDVLKFDSSEKDKNGMTVLMFAAYGGSMDMMRYLVEERKIDVNDNNKEGHTAMYYAHDPQMIQYLDSHGAIRPVQGLPASPSR